MTLTALLLLLGCCLGALARQPTAGLRGSLSPGAQLLEAGQEAAAFDDFLEEPLANYLRRGDSLFKPSQPAMYLAADTPQDVVAGVKYALDNGLKASFRGQGHHEAGVAFLPGGLTIDMSALKDVHVDPVTASCRFEAGLQGLELADVTSQYGLHFRIGHATSNGVAGFILGGGAGWGGLAIDQITGFDVVSTWLYPDQALSIIKVDAQSYPDLFSALQGGGQMLGAVTAFYADLQPLPPDNMVRSVVAAWPLQAASTFWEVWTQYNATTERSPLVEVDATYTTVPGVGPVAALGVWDWSPDNRTGTQDWIDGWVDTAGAAGALVMDTTAPYLDVISAFNASQQYENVTHYAQSVVVANITDEILDILNAGFANATTPLSLYLVDDLGVAGKPNEGTAWGWKGANLIYLWAFWTRTAGGAAVDGDAQHVAWVRNAAAQLDPFKLGHYINFQNFEDEDATRLSFSPPNWALVQAAKAKYDPQNLFRGLDFFHSGPAGEGALNGL